MRQSRAEQLLRLLVEIPAVLVVVAEVVILFVGIVARAVFNSPIVWSDELASILFLWLAMLGTAIAVQRSNHMRLTFFVSLLSPRAQAWAETLAAGAVALFLAIDFASNLRIFAGSGLRRDTGTRLVRVSPSAGAAGRLRGCISELLLCA